MDASTRKIYAKHCQITLDRYESNPKSRLESVYIVHIVYIYNFKNLSHDGHLASQSWPWHSKMGDVNGIDWGMPFAEMSKNNY